MDADVIVVGGGVIGCIAARELTPEYDVVVLEKGQVAAEATALSAGEITITPSYSDAPAVAAHANEFFRAYSGTGEFTFHERSSIELVKEAYADAARRRVARLRENGIDVTFIEPDVFAAEYPWFAADQVGGAVRHEETGFVDPYTYAVTLKEEAEEAGAEFRTETAVTGFVLEDDAMRGVETDAGTLTAETVVAAAGWRTQQLLEGVLEIPLRPYRTQCLVFEPETPLGQEFPMGWIPGEHVYFRPELNGDLLVGGWSFAEDDPEGASGQADEEFLDHVAGLLPRYFEGFETAGFVNGWAGIDGATPDTRPIIDAPAAAPDGLVVATGFHGRGIMTSPVAAALVREHVTGEPSGIPREHFVLDRFESTSPDFRFESISAGSYD